MTPEFLLSLAAGAFVLGLLILASVAGAEMVGRARRARERRAEERTPNAVLVNQIIALRAEECMWLWRAQIERKRSMTLLVHRQNHDGSCVGMDCAICQWILNVSTEFLPYEQIVKPEQAVLANVLPFARDPEGGA